LIGRRDARGSPSEDPAPVSVAATAESPPKVAVAPAVDVDRRSASDRVRLDSPNQRTDHPRMLTGGRDSMRVVPALRDVSFTVPRGSTLAIVGRNGAGKSTLLRALCGILPPEEGRIVVRGRLTLLSPGLGMNQNLSGRENIRLGGLAAGIPDDRLDELTGEMAEFAQLGEYLDFPLRTYSQGMRTRLGVAVAAFLDPEILLIDEALTGGDAGFQAHVAQRIADLTGQGRTIVLVTHGLSSVKTMATEALWLHQGQVAAMGDPDDVVTQYMRYCRLESLAPEHDDQ
jgi:ABC-type polysaccharide/polyol phosphate transport system ATPase subunit